MIESLIKFFQTSPPVETKPNIMFCLQKLFQDNKISKDMYIMMHTALLEGQVDKLIDLIEHEIIHENSKIIPLYSLVINNKTHLK